MTTAEINSQLLAFYLPYFDIMPPDVQLGVLVAIGYLDDYDDDEENS